MKIILFICFMGHIGHLIEARHLQNVTKITSDVTDVEETIMKGDCTCRARINGVERCAPCNCGCGYLVIFTGDVQCKPCNCECEVCRDGSTSRFVFRYKCCGCGGGCFPSSSRVTLADGKSVRMYELQVGDQVKTVKSDGSVVYSGVRTFLHKTHTVTRKFLSIATAFNKTVTLTDTHLIYARKWHTAMFNTVYASEVSIGDEVMTDRNGIMITASVINITKSNFQGLYNPLTMEGNMIVDGVLASCYASAGHDLAHFALIPKQWCPDLIDWIFGIYDTFPVYVTILLEVKEWLYPNGITYTV